MVKPRDELFKFVFLSRWKEKLGITSYHNFSESTRSRVARLLDPITSSLATRVFRAIHIAVIMGGIIGVILLSDTAYQAAEPLLVIPLFIFALEYCARLWIAPELVVPESRSGARRRWAMSVLGLVDGLAVISIPVAWLAGATSVKAEILGMLWVFKLARYSQGLSVLGG